MSGPHPYRVIAKLRESSLITSFHLAPVQGKLAPFKPGQFLVFRLTVDGAEVIRNYSLSGPPDPQGHYRISVKREEAGAISRHLHDGVQVGDVLHADGPRGAFVLDEASPRPVVLLSGGVGLTPMVSMLHRLAASQRRTLFLHACQSGEVHALRDEVGALVAAHPHLSAHYIYATPSQTDRDNGLFHDEGMITRAVLQRLLCLDDYDVYLCGPPPFMQAIYALLRDLGVAKERIAYEFFGPATVLGGAVAATVAPAPAAAVGGQLQVEFRKSGLVTQWTGAADSLLDLAESMGLSPDFSCRAGVCSTCKSQIISGDVAYFEEPLDEMQAGEVLLCCSRPTTSVVLDL